LFVAFDVWSVGDNGTKAPGKHLLQIGDEDRCSLPPRVHASFYVKRRT
jgi:hypothetical protein